MLPRMKTKWWFSLLFLLVFAAPGPVPPAVQRGMAAISKDALRAHDEFLASDAPLGISAERLFQGPIADALTHTGQLAMLRRIAGAPMRGENYARAEIARGRVGAEQPKPGFEFD